MTAEDQIVSHRYYDSAESVKNSFKGWHGSKGLTGDFETIGTQKPIMMRAWDLFRNNPTTNSILNTLGNGVIGTGLKCSPSIDYKTLGIDKAESKEKAAELSRYWNLWASNKYSTADRKNNFYMLQMRVFVNSCLSGDSFALLRDNNRIDSLKQFPFALTVEGVDAQMVCNPYGTFNTMKIAGGVEVNDFGEEIAYHFRKISSENSFLNYQSMYNYETTRIPTYGKSTGRRNVLHVHVPVRFNERRGVSIFAPIMEHLKQLDRYEKSELMATIIASFFTAFVKTETGEGLGLPQGEGEDGQMYDDLVMGSGSINYMRPGEDIVLANPNRPNPNFAAFEEAYWDKVSSFVGLSPEMVKKRYTSSYTAARAALLQVYHQFKIKRMEFNFLFNQPIYEEFVTELVLRGLVELPGYLIDPIAKEAWLRTTWVGDAMGMIDPVKEVTAAEKMRDNQWKSSDQIARELTGNNYFETLESLEDEKSERDAVEMPLPGEYERKTKRIDAERKAQNAENSEENNA